MERTVLTMLLILLTVLVLSGCARFAGKAGEATHAADTLGKSTDEIEKVSGEEGWWAKVEQLLETVSPVGEQGKEIVEVADKGGEIVKAKHVCYSDKPWRRSFWWGEVVEFNEVPFEIPKRKLEGERCYRLKEPYAQITL
jgi:hypothetical protein